MGAGIQKCLLIQLSADGSWANAARTFWPITPAYAGPECMPVAGQQVEHDITCYAWHADFHLPRTS